MNPIFAWIIAETTAHYYRDADAALPEVYKQAVAFTGRQAQVSI